jgi:Arc/MetJ family transcription regulator
MQITLNLDESLLNEALQLTNFTTQEELVNFALQELVRSRSRSVSDRRSDSSGTSHRQRNLFDLAGQIQFAPDFDHKALRETRHAAD